MLYNDDEIIYIEYQKGIPFSVITVNEEFRTLTTYDFEEDCWNDEGLMFHESGSGGNPKQLQAPNYVKGSHASFWISDKAAFRGKPKYCRRLAKPIERQGSANPFEMNAREIAGVEFCEECQRFFDEEGCPLHFNK